MKSQKMLNQLDCLPFFNKLNALQLARGLDLKKTTIDTYISRFLGSKRIISLKNGLYISRKFYEENSSDFSYLFYLANIIYQPSYTSLFTALQYYDISTEAIYNISSVSPKITRQYNNKLGSFRYNSIHKKYFCDYYLQKAKFSFFIASPAKAIFDVLYFKTKQFRLIKEKDIIGLLDELRIDLDEISKKEKQKLYKMLKNIYE